MKFIYTLLLSFFAHAVFAQVNSDDWMTEHLGNITWQKTYTGFLADYHPVTIVLASDKREIAGYLMHHGDSQQHRLLGEWNDSRLFQLQERNDDDRLTGYLTGKIKDDQLDLKWISVNQDRIFEIRATTEQLIKINSKSPAAEWIAIATNPTMSISVQKIYNGLVTGFVIADESYIRFDGTCLDGTCSIWQASYLDPNGDKHKLQMHQKTSTTYKATLDNVSFGANILYTQPLQIRQVDHSTGFIDFTFPKLNSQLYGDWVDAFWHTDSTKLTEAGSLGVAPRLTYRSSGWIEIVDETSSYVSGMVTFINPNGGHREAFLLLKKEGELINPSDLLNTPEDFSKGASLALASMDAEHDETFYSWVENTGYTVLIPTGKGIVMATEFNTIYGDALRLLSVSESKTLIRKKYWKYFGW